MLGIGKLLAFLQNFIWQDLCTKLTIFFFKLSTRLVSPINSADLIIVTLPSFLSLVTFSTDEVLQITQSILQ